MLIKSCQQVPCSWSILCCSPHLTITVLLRDNCSDIKDVLLVFWFLLFLYVSYGETGKEIWSE